MTSDMNGVLKEGPPYILSMRGVVIKNKFENCENVHY